ncbi:hypothetical protein LZ32DRAFT_622488 [Colletotrichum eremochloae]|nr:hypothetical protein LZ32DRAFT_622488 [Colletotrichum eremochloae]
MQSDKRDNAKMQAAKGLPIQVSRLHCPRVYITVAVNDTAFYANFVLYWPQPLTDVQPNQTYHRFPAREVMYQASGWTSGRATVDGRRLYLRGFRICKIRAVGTSPIDYTSLQSMKRAFAEWMEITKQCGVLMDDNHDQFYKELAAVLCAEVHHCRMSKEEWTAWKQRFVLRARTTSRVSDKKLLHEIRSQASANSQLWRRYEPGDSPAHGDLEQFLNSGNLSYLRNPNYRLAVAHSISQRAFYLTEDKRMGLCLPHARVGDEVWGVHGANVPFIFRSVEEQGETRSFSMVGDCYLRGAMDGEAADFQALKDVGINQEGP